MVQYLRSTVIRKEYAGVRQSNYHARKGEKDADGKGLSWPGIAVDDVSSCQ